MEFCKNCNCLQHILPDNNCNDINHWKYYCQQNLENRDKLDVAEWLSSYEKVKSYNCHGCNRHYELPTHIDHFTCVCGHRCRLRHLGGTNPDQAVIDAAISYFGNERSAQLAWIAEIIGGEHCMNYTADEIRKMISQEMDRWQLTESGWRKK
jgi:hypothetical protein